MISYKNQQSKRHLRCLKSVLFFYSSPQVQCVTIRRFKQRIVQFLDQSYVNFTQTFPTSFPRKMEIGFLCSESSSEDFLAQEEGLWYQHQICQKIQRWEAVSRLKLLANHEQCSFVFLILISLNCLRSQVSCNVSVQLLQLHVMSQWGDEKWTCTSPTELNWTLVFRRSLFVLSIVNRGNGYETRQSSLLYVFVLFFGLGYFIKSF